MSPLFESGSCCLERTRQRRSIEQLQRELWSSISGWRIRSSGKEIRSSSHSDICKGAARLCGPRPSTARTALTPILRKILSGRNLFMYS